MSSLHARIGLSLATVFAAGAIVLAQDAPAPEGGGDRPVRQFDRGFPDRPWGFRRREIPPEEWDAVSKFMEENFPNRWAVYQHVVSAPGREVLSREMKIRIVGRYRQLERVHRDNEALYEVTLQQARAEDAVWGTVRTWRELSDSVSESERASVLEKLRDEVRKMMLKTFDEREARINSLREALAREEQELALDRKRIDKLIEHRVETLTSDNPFRGPDGMGPSTDREGAQRPGPGELPEGDRPNPGNRGDRRGPGGGFAAPQQPE